MSKWVRRSMLACLGRGRVSRKVRSCIGALGSRAPTDERMRSSATVPSGATSGAASTAPMSAMFIGAVEVSAARRGRYRHPLNGLVGRRPRQTVEVSCSRRPSRAVLVPRCGASTSPMPG